MKTDIKDIVSYSTAIFMAVQEVIPVISNIVDAVKMIGNVRSAVDRCRRHYHQKASDRISDEIIDEKIGDARTRAVEILLGKAVEKTVHDCWGMVKTVEPGELSSYIRDRLGSCSDMRRGTDLEIIHIRAGDEDKFRPCVLNVCKAVNDNFSKMYNTVSTENASLVIEIEDMKRIDERLAESLEGLSKRLDNLYSPLDTALPPLPEGCVARYHVVSRLAETIRTGRLCFFSGEGGSGKTTLARLVCDMLSSQYAVAWVGVDNNARIDRRKTWYHSVVGREFSIMFGRLAFPSFSQFGNNAVSDYEIRDAFSSCLSKGPTLLVVDMNTVCFTKDDYDFLMGTETCQEGGPYAPFPDDWRFLVLTRKLPDAGFDGCMVDFGVEGNGVPRTVAGSARMTKDEIVEQLAAGIRYIDTDYGYVDYLLSDLADYADGNPLLASHLACEVNYYSDKTVQPIMSLRRRLLKNGSGWTGDDVFSRLMNILDFGNGGTRWGDDIAEYLKLCVLLPTEPLAHPHVVFGESRYSLDKVGLLKEAGILRETRAGIICHDQIKNAISGYFFGTMVVSRNDDERMLGINNGKLMDFLLSLTIPLGHEERSLADRLAGEILGLKGADPEIRRHKVEPLVINLFMLAGLMDDTRYFELFEQGGGFPCRLDDDRAVALFKLFETALYVLKGGSIPSSMIKNVSSFILSYLKGFSIVSDNLLLYERCCFMLALTLTDRGDLGADLKKEAMEYALQRMASDCNAAVDAAMYATSYLFSRANFNMNGYDDFMMKFHAYLAILGDDGVKVRATGESGTIHEVYTRISRCLDRVGGTDAVVQKSRILDNFAGGLGAYGYFQLQYDLKMRNYLEVRAGLEPEAGRACSVLEDYYLRFDLDADLAWAKRVFPLMDYELRDALAFRLNNLGYAMMDLALWEDPSFLDGAEGCLLASRSVYRGLENNNSNMNLKALLINQLRKAVLDKDGRAGALESAGAYLDSFAKAYRARTGIAPGWYMSDEGCVDDVALEVRSLYLEKLFLEGRISSDELVGMTRSWARRVRKGTPFFNHMRFLEQMDVEVDVKFEVPDVIRFFASSRIGPGFHRDFSEECLRHVATRDWNLSNRGFAEGIKGLYARYVAEG